MPWLAVLIAAFIVGTRPTILVPFIIGWTHHTVVVDIHTVSVGQTVPAGVKNVFSVNLFGRHIRWSVWRPSSLEGIDLYGRLLELLGQVSDGCGEVYNGFALGHNRVPVCCRRCCQFHEGIVGVLLIFLKVVCAVVSRRPGGIFLLLLVFTLCRLKVCLEVCPVFVGACLIVPLVPDIVKLSRIVYNSVHCVSDTVIRDCPSSISCKLLNFLNSLCEFLKGTICVPWVSQLGAVHHEVLIFYLTVLCKNVCDNVPHTNVCKASVPVKYSGQEFFCNQFCDLIFPGTLQIHPLFVLPAHF